MDGRPNGFLSSYDPLFKMVARDRIYGNVIYLFAIIELFAGKRLLSTSGTRAYVITEDIYRVICLRLFLLFLHVPLRSSRRMAITPIHSHVRARARTYTRIRRTVCYVSCIVSIAKGHTVYPTFHFRASKLFYGRIRHKLRCFLGREFLMSLSYTLISCL